MPSPTILEPERVVEPLSGPADHRPPPPDLQELVAMFGSYSAIPAQAWTDFDAAVARYNDAMRNGRFWRNT